MSPIEELLAFTWSRELTGTSISPGDDFFTLGGTPERAEAVLTRVRTLFGVGLSIVDLFTDPTLAAFAARVDGAMVADVAPGAAEKYWEERLVDLPALRFPADRPGPARAAPDSKPGLAVCQRPWPEALVLRLRELGPLLESTFFMTLLSGFAVLLSRYTGEGRIPLAVPRSQHNEREPGGRGVLCVEPAPDAGVRDVLAQVRSEVLDLERHRNLPSDPRWNSKLDGCAGFRLCRTPEQDSEAGARNLEMVVSETEHGFVSRLRYRGDLFDATTAQRMVLHYQTLLEGLTETPEARVSELSALSRAEHHQAAWEWSATRRKDCAEGEECLHDLFARQAAQRADTPAVMDEDRVLTFGELDRRSNRWAHRLRCLGVGPEVAVGICLERSAEAIVAVLAVLKAGGAYVPIDPAYPAERRRWIFDNAQVRACVARRSLPEECGAFEIMDPEKEAERLEALPATAPASGVQPSNLAYVIHTSGSTGRPKGVMVRHRSVVHLLRALSGTVYPEEENRLRVALNASLAFDASVKQWIQLLAGHTLCLCPEKIRQDPEKLLALVADQRVDALDATPSQLEVCKRAGLFERPPWGGSGGETRPPGGGSEGTRLPPYLLCGGEALTPALWRRLAGLRGTQVLNVYGPTEATVDATFARLAGNRGPHLGRPLPGVDVHVTDAELRPVPIDVPGEIAIGGAGLARGYLRRPSETAARFVPHPWSAAAGERLYRTGDRASHLPDGALVFLGRLDHQVKIRGFRIEPGEIEEVLREHQGVAEAVVVPRPELDGQLVAYLVPKTGDGRITAARLRKSLAMKLPDYMVPAALVVLPSLPRTVHGKLDRAGLPAPPRRPPRKELTPPKGPTETLLAGLWTELLGLDRVGRDEDFFDLGGHSILAIHVMTEVRERRGTRLPLAAILERPTIASLARLLDEESSETSSPVVLLGQAPSVREAPLFCVHGIGGHLFRLVHLARLLSGRRPFYGLQGFSERGDLSHLQSVYEMAGRYRRAIRHTQKEGPYRLAGYSLGYWIAFEIARQLEEEGQEVDFLGFLAYSEQQQHRPEVVEKLGFEAVLADELGVALRLREFLPLAPRERLDYVLSRAKNSGVLPAEFETADAERFVEAFHANFTALESYEPGPCRSRATFFVALEDPPMDPGKLWGGLLGGGMEIVRVPGDHTTLLQPPHVESLAREIEARLELPSTTT